MILENNFLTIMVTDVEFNEVEGAYKTFDRRLLKLACNLVKILVGGERKSCMNVGTSLKSQVKTVKDSLQGYFLHISSNYL